MSSFTVLVAHDAHVDGHLCGCQPRTQLIHCPFPRTLPEKEECKNLDPCIESVVSVLHNVDHYCVMEANICHHEITIYDGLKRPLKNWANHIVNILKRCKLADRETDFTLNLEPGSMCHEVFNLTFGSRMQEEVRDSQYWFSKE